MSSGEYKKFLSDLIDSFRQEIGAFTNRVAIDLQAPVQISLIWFKSEKNDLQLFLINHNKYFEDKGIDIFGPYNMSEKSDFQNFKDILDKGHIFNYIGNIEDETTLRDRIVRMIRSKNKILKEDPKYKIVSSGVFYKDCFYFFHNGDIFKRSLNDIMHYYQKEKSEDKKVNEMLKNLPPKYEMVPFFAGYINPPVWVGDLPTLTIEEQIKGKRLSKFVKTIYKGEILDRKLILKNDGYLGISMKCKVDEFPEEKEIVSTIKILNFLFSVFLLMGFRIKTVQASDFYYTTYLPEKDFLAETHRDYSKSKELFDEKYKFLDLVSFKKSRIIVSLDKLIQSIDLAKKVINNLKLFNSLLLLIHSHSNLLNGELNQSFILSWTVLEQYLYYKWDLFLDKKEISGKRLKKLKGREYTASVKTEMLNLFGYITKEDFKILNDLRNKRNKFMHEIKEITRKEAIQSRALALEYSKVRINDYIRESKKQNSK